MTQEQSSPEQEQVFRGFRLGFGFAVGAGVVYAVFLVARVAFLIVARIFETLAGSLS